MLRTLVLVLMMLAPVPALAQESLADIRADLSALAGVISQLRSELVATGATSGVAVAGSALERMNAIEAQMERLTAKTEALENRINKVVADGTNRIGDLEFRVCELDSSCDVSKLGDTTPLGGKAGTAPVAPPPAANGGEMAVGEKADFDRAKGALDSGSFRSAADLFATFAETYPGSPLTGEAAYFKGEALMSLGQSGAAARAWLESFSAAPQGPKAPDALLKLGMALNTLGQAQEACVTLGEVSARFPTSDAAVQATEARNSMGCM